MIDYKPKERQELEELYRKQNVRINELEQENEKLKEDNRFLTKISKEYMEKENIVEVTEFTGLYKDNLEQENKKLRLGKERLEELEKIKDEIKDLRQENNYLKLIQKDNESQISCYFKERDELREENRKLKEEIRFLEQCLDNKEKVNISLREEIQQRINAVNKK